MTPLSSLPSPRFVTTRWSLVLQAKGKAVPQAREALADLCRAYWYPLYAFVRKRSRDGHEAQDLTQSFFTRLLEKDFLGKVTPDRGRFRAFLLAAIKNFIANEWDQARAAKRGGGQPLLSLDAVQIDWDSGESRFLNEPSHELTAERLFERQWALALLDRVVNRLRDEHAELGKLTQFDVLQQFLSIDREAAQYAAAARQLTMTESAVRVATHRLRKRSRALLREEIAQTVASREDVEDELRQLFKALAR